MGIILTFLKFFAKALSIFVVGFVIFLVFAPSNIKDNFFEARYEIGTRLGLVSERVAVSGYSMYPTFAKDLSGGSLREISEEVIATPITQVYPTGFRLLGRTFFEYKVQRGDIVSFSNEKVKKITQELHGKEAGFIKRVIGLPGDKLMIRDGLVYINGDVIEEPYIAKARSTFGSEYFNECKDLIVPEGKLFVMGDNRKGSGDSRHELGVISYLDIDHVIPINKQRGVLDKRWRDTSKDTKLESKIKINKQEFLSLLNQKRSEEGVKPLVYEKKLEDSARRRGVKMLEFNDFSFEATRSGYTMKRSLIDAGYSNIVYGEIPIQGYYEADELIEYFFEFPSTKKFLLSKDDQDFGIAEVEGEINGCPTQVVVLHFAGYVPPNYGEESIQSWKKALDNINEVMPSWEGIRGNSNYDQKKVEELLTLMTTVKDIYSRIYEKMRSNQWLTDAEEKSIKDADNMYKRITELQKELNN